MYSIVVVIMYNACRGVSLMSYSLGAYTFAAQLAQDSSSCAESIKTLIADHSQRAIIEI